MNQSTPASSATATESNIQESTISKEDSSGGVIRCNFSGYGLRNGSSQTVDLPEEFVTNPEIFFDIVNKKTWDQHFNDEQKARLTKLLPASISTSKEAADQFLSTFFDTSSRPSYLVHPMQDFHQKLAGGYYDAACAQEVRQLKACARLHYEHRLREYYGRVLKKALVYRRKLLEAAASVPEGEPFSYDWKAEYLDGIGGTHNEVQASPTWRRALKRSRLMIMECKGRAGDLQILSSDDEDFVASVPSASGARTGPNGHHHSNTSTSSYHPSHSRQSSVTGPFDAGRSSGSNVKSTLAKPGRNDLDLHEPFETAEIKDMLKEYRRLRRSHPEHPSLEFDDTELDDVVDRCGSEIRLLAQKWGVYTKQPPRLEVVQSSPNSHTTSSTNKKPTTGKHAKTSVSKDK